MNLISFFPAHTRKPATVAGAFDNMFNEFFNNDFPVSFRNGYLQKSPAVNVVENDNFYRIELAAPGLDKGDFEVKGENRLLGFLEKKKKKEEKKRKKFPPP